MIDQGRRRLIGATAALALPSLSVGAELAPQSAAPSSARPTANAIKRFGGIHQIDAGPLSIGYVDIGRISGRPLILLHGWPYDIHAFADVVPLLADAGFRVIIPYLRGFGATRFRSAQTVRNGQQAALADDVIALMDALGLRSATLAGFDWGARSACVVAALWPARCDALVTVSGYLIGSQAAGRIPLAPEAELGWWYQYYFATDRGLAGYAANRRDFARLIWRTASPQWAFNEATFACSAAALDNPDHAAIVVHNYRWRLGASGETRFDAVEQQLITAPVITVPTISIEGDANHAPHPEPSTYAGKFVGKYLHRTASGGIGHNLPQESPLVFARAVIDVGML